jgi:chemotaxis protein methyltransferase CheR
MNPEAEIEVENLEIQLLLEAVHAKYGYDLREYASSSIRRRVLAALARSGLRHLGELQHRVLRDPDFFATVLEDLTVRVTGMFRDPEFYRTFRARVIPHLRTYPLLRIWHSGCATGEEVYASAILLSEEGLYERTQIYATDLSPGALEQAKEGMYPVDLLGAFTENYQLSGGTSSLSNYYTAAYDHIAMRESLRKNILFFQHNLVSDQVFGEMQVIFCRNVLIYFGQDLKTRVLAKFAESLCPGGFFCLGAGERLARPSKNEGWVEFASDARIYRQRGQGHGVVRS